MNDITSVSLTLKECSTSKNESELSDPHSNGNVDYKEFSKVSDMDKTYGSINKGVPMMSISSSMQDPQLTVMRSNKSLCSISSEYNANIGSSNTVASLNNESASFVLLSRRESSLENLAEDENDLHNACISPYVDINTVAVVEKQGITDNTISIPRKSESSRLRRTLSSLLSCCTQKSRRSPYPYKADLIALPVGDSDPIVNVDKCSNLTSHKQAASRSAEGDHISFSCLKLRKFLDIFDESDSPGKRTQQPVRVDTSRPILTPIIPRDSDKSDSPSKNLRNADTFQSENGGANLARPVLLGAIKPADQGKKCFIIDLDETLVHSSFKMVEKADFKVGVDIEGTVHTVYVLKRPYVDVFLQKMGRIFECVLFTASLAKYADPVTDFLDKWRVFRWRLFRESCVFHRGNYVKDLSMLGRHTDQVAILDNSPASYMFHPDNAVQITSWFDDPRDTALLDLIPYFEQLAAAPSIPPFLVSIKPPQRATVPVSVMLTSPTSISLQPVSQLQLQQQQQQQQSFSPITSVDSPGSAAATADLHSGNVAPAGAQLPLLPITSLYIRDINPYSPFSRSLRSLSNTSSKSLPSMLLSLECRMLTALKTSRSDTDLISATTTTAAAAASSTHIDPSSGGSFNAGPRCRRRLRKSTSDIPPTHCGDRLFPIDYSLVNFVASRSFPTLVTTPPPASPASPQPPQHSHTQTPTKHTTTTTTTPHLVVVVHEHQPHNSGPRNNHHSFDLPRSASLSFHSSPTDANRRSHSFSHTRIARLRGDARVDSD